MYFVEWDQSAAKVTFYVAWSPVFGGYQLSHHVDFPDAVFAPVATVVFVVFLAEHKYPLVEVIESCSLDGPNVFRHHDYLLGSQVESWEFDNSG